MEKRNIAVNLEDYTVYFVAPSKQYIAVDRQECNKITALMDGSRLGHVSAEEKTKGKILSYDSVTNTYDIKSDLLIEFPIRDFLEITVIQVPFGVIQ